jgi:hypothetical protein
MFRRKQVTNYMQQAEKDFWNNLAYIYDHIQLVTDYSGKVSKLKNVEEIQKKQLTTIEEITRAYKGEPINMVINQIEAAGSDINLLFHQLVEYKLYGLFFTGLYDQIRNQSRKRKLVDIFGSKELIIEEQFLKQKTIDAKDSESLNFNVNGRIIDYCAGDWASEAECLGVKTADGQMPVLDHYNGEIRINISTSILEKAEISLSLSYGEHYKREQIYSLLLMSEEDIEDLF